MDTNNIKHEVIESLKTARTAGDIEEIRIREMGKNGRISGLLKSLGELPPEERKTAGKQYNILKTEVEKAIEEHAAAIRLEARNAEILRNKVDISLPVTAGAASRGRIHPLSEVGDELLAIFASMGFGVEQGPDIESEYYNFEALNIADSHPARDMHDTFYLPGNKGLLRTHTSPVQIRAMERLEPPFRFVAPGRTYRRDSDQTHTPMFHQVEGMAVGPDIHLGHLKWTLQHFLETFFETEVELRFRPSYFPFTEPSLEVDVRCERVEGEIRIGTGTDWLEVLGCGMVHPKVLGNCGINPDTFQGFAFGAGIDRLAMLKYGIPDLRSFFDGDVRWIQHYGFVPLHAPTLEGGLAP
ncbi:MAG: phenylalanine--tRNA ligase subunit alpha [Hyphomicrobiales bacterium]|nr:phenylalanine--tRNA ligase subunit alpha [Hyphomicrobiales bacterium]MCY4049075.1 phenylalanine--tRNA ligase subunit alpha [Hyphomicrobiales bacterium]MCY4053249.1 phenylalanine--tRNA ligase subunit alpha [Hyphomicrobiales bacterium]